MSRNNSQNRITFPSSKTSKTSSSSDTSDDDDDDNNLMTKIAILKINEPKSQVLSDDDDDAKIINAMRLIGKTIGNPSTNTPGFPTDMNKSGSNGTSNIPPPIILRSTAYEKALHYFFKSINLCSECILEQ